MQGSGGFWLGIALALPIGLVVNLITPLTQKGLLRYSARRRSRAWEASRKAELQANKLMSAPDTLNRELLHATLRITMLYATGAIIGSALSIFGYLDFPGQFTFAVSSLISLGIGITVLNIARKWLGTIRLIHKLENSRSVAQSTTQLNIATVPDKSSNPLPDSAG